MSKKDVVLSEEESKILNALYTLGFRYIARDRSMFPSTVLFELTAYEDLPERDENYEEEVYWSGVFPSNTFRINPNLFTFIKWEDEEPFEIKI